MKRLMSLGVSLALLASHVSPVLAANEGWQESNGTWRYVKADGSLATGWLKDGYSWYFMNDEGVMTTSTWVGSHEHWYWIGAGGVMQESKEIEYNGQRYYLKGTGVMARDYVKDGWEYDAEGVGHPLSSSNSVVINSADDLEGLETVEGNLYISEEATEDIDLSSIDIQGKLVILKEDITVTVDDVTANGLSIQGTNSEVVLAGTTEVGTVEIERGSTLSADRSFDGTVEEIKVQSSVTEPTEISVEADKVETRTFSEVTLNEAVGEVTVVANNKITVNADVEEIQVLSSAPETVIEVTRGNKVETITADAPTSVEGNGTVGLIEANVDGTTADEDVTIEDVDKGTGVEDAPEATKPSRPSSGGGSYVPPAITYYTVTYKNTDGTVLGTSVVSSGSTVTNVPEVNPSVGNKISWFNGSELFDIENDQVRSNITLVAVEGSDDFTAGNGSEAYPYLISNAEELSAVRTLSSDMQTRKAYSFKLLSDINISQINVAEWSSVTEYFCGTFDGNNHKLFASNVPSYFIGNTVGDVTVQNLTVVQNTTFIGLICSANYTNLKGTVKLENITVESDDVVQVENNDSSFITFADSLENAPVIFENCTNYADINTSNKYAGIFIGGYLNAGRNNSKTGNIQFINCVNYGDMRGQHVGFFTGNNYDDPDINKITIENCSNYGTLIGTISANFFAENNPNKLGTIAANEYAKSLNINKENGMIGVVNPEGLSISKNTDGTIKITSPADDSAIAYYVVNAYAQNSFGDAGSSYAWLSERVEKDVKKTANQYKFTRMMDSETYLRQNSGAVLNWDENTREEYMNARYLIIDDVMIINYEDMLNYFPGGASEAHMDTQVKFSVDAYAENGQIVASHIGLE